jgi:glycosyltransferase involved in cell wall biosynthesis
MVTVSVIIPTYNRADMVSDAIESALAQTLTNIEIIVVDDASTDGTEAVLSSYADEITYIKHDENRGGSAARNTGIKAASGEYIAFLDSDDIWAPEKLEQQITELERRNGGWIAAYCDFRQTRENQLVEKIDNLVRRPTGFEGDDEIIRRIFLRTFAHGGSSTLVVKKSIVDAIGGFDPSFQRHQDLEFLVRLLKKGKLAYVDEILVFKHDTGNPSIEVVSTAIENFNEKFSKEIESRDFSEEVYLTQQFMFAKYDFRSGDFKKGIRRLRNSKCPHHRDGLSLLLGVVTGLKKLQIPV